MRIFFRQIPFKLKSIRREQGGKMTDQYYAQFSNDLRRSRYEDEDVEREIDRRNMERGARQARPGKPWYDEPHRQRALHRGRETWEDAEEAAWEQSREQEQRWGGSRRADEADEWWRTPGPYEGIGPRDYRRSDKNIREDICERLTRHGRIDASDIDIQVQAGEVTLTGKVGDRRQKRLAEDLAESVPGVVDVHNELRLV
jgi:osmotically-inducible protein OsmY